MRYNPDTERRIDIDEIARQCREAICRTPEVPKAAPPQPTAVEPSPSDHVNTVKIWNSGLTSWAAPVR